MGKKKILLVEDENDLRALVVERLTAAGYEVYQAADGAQGLELAGKVKPDCIVSDAVMPTMDGNKLFKALRATDAGKHIPFIILTARAKMKDYFEVLDVDAFMDKPFKMEELIQCIERVLLPAKTEPPPKSSTAPDKEAAGRTPNIEISPEMASVIDAEAIDKTARLVDSPQEPPGKKEASPAKARSAPKKKILIVDDNEVVYCELQKMLVQHDCESKVVHTPGRCLSELNRSFPDIILSKYVLHEMNADVMANIIKEMPRFKETPIIIYGDIGRHVGNDEEGQEGTRQFVFNPEGYEVLRKVSELLRKKHP